MIINGIWVLGDELPLAGRKFGVAKVTSIDGEVPEIFKEPSYAIKDDVMAARITLPPSEYGFEDSPLENIRAIYVFVEDIGESEDGQHNFRIVESIDELAEPFDLTDDLKKEYGEYFTKARSVRAGVEFVEFELEDADTHKKSTCIAMVSSYEKMYLNAQMKYFEENGAVTDPGRLLEPQLLSQIRSDASPQMLFTEMLDKGVNLYNGIHYMNKADTIAAMIAECTYINESGDVGPLTFTAVEKLFSNVKDRLLTNQAVAKPVVRRSEE